jgi:hypothetical protein
MIRLTCDYQDGCDPVVVEISDSSVNEQLIVECANTQMFDIFYHHIDEEDINPKFQELEEAITRYGAIFQLYDVWDGWICGGEDEGFDEFTKVEFID